MLLPDRHTPLSDGRLSDSFIDMNRKLRQSLNPGLAAGGSTSRTSQVGEAAGKELATIGANWDLSNVIDILTDLTEPSDATQRYSNDVDTVRNFALAFAKGLHEGGIKSCTVEALTLSLQDMYRQTIDDGEQDHDVASPQENEIFILRHLLESNALDSLMLSSCIYDFEDRNRSRKSISLVIEHLIRGLLRFEGPVITDFSALDSDSTMCATHAPLHALLAGCDMVCLPRDFNVQIASIHAVRAAIEANVLSPTAVTASSNRVIALKSQIQTSFPTLSGSTDELSSLVASHIPLMQTAYRDSIVTLQTTSSPLPSLTGNLVLLLLSPSVPVLDTRTGQSDPFEPLGRAIARTQPRIRHVPYTLSSGLTPTHLAFLRRAGAVVLVLACPSSALIDVQMEVWRDVEHVLTDMDQQSGQKVKRVVMSAGDVRDLAHGDMLDKGWWAVACWDYTRGALEAVAEVITGQREATGRLPIYLRR